MARRSTKYYRKNENEVMQRLGFKPTVNSGAGWIGKEDGENDSCMCQLKSTDKDNISININDLHVLEQNAMISHKISVFAVQFIQTDEVWIMIKPEHIKLVQGISEGEQIKIEDLKVVDCLIDNEEETAYNKNEQDIDKSIVSNYLARMDYNQKKEKELSEIKENRKRRERKSRWKKN